jgi:hypothetical protein
MSINSASQRGMTVIEVTLVVGIFAVLGMVSIDIFVSSNELVDSSRSRHRAEERLRRNFEAIANVMRAADIDTLDGFDEDTGAATTLQFARVDGVDREGTVYLGDETLEWRALDISVDGVESPGQIVHTLAGVETVLATRVPASGFEVRLEDGVLVIHLQTYYSRQGHTNVAEGVTAVAVRN